MNLDGEAGPCVGQLQRVFGIGGTGETKGREKGVAGAGCVRHCYFIRRSVGDARAILKESSLVAELDHNAGGIELAIQHGEGGGVVRRREGGIDATGFLEIEDDDAASAIELVVGGGLR